MVTRARTVFTVEEANRSLPLVRSIVTDVAGLWRDLLKAREDYGNSSPEHDRILRELAEYIQELHEIGCHLRDFEAGIVDFPAPGDEDRALTWRLGEAQVSAELERATAATPLDVALDDADSDATG